MIAVMFYHPISALSLANHAQKISIAAVIVHHRFPHTFAFGHCVIASALMSVITVLLFLQAVYDNILPLFGSKSHFNNCLFILIHVEARLVIITMQSTPLFWILWLVWTGLCVQEFPTVVYSNGPQIVVLFYWSGCKKFLSRFVLNKRQSQIVDGPFRKATPLILLFSFT